MKKVGRSTKDPVQLQPEKPEKPSITVEQLRARPWAGAALSAGSKAWRARMDKSILAIGNRITLTQIKPWAIGAEHRSVDQDQQNLIDGLLCQSIGHSTNGNRRDRMSLARWMGRAMAFAHDHIVGEGHEWHGGAKEPYEILNLLVDRSAAVAWIDQPMPSWARSLTCTPLDDPRRYRPWPDIDECLEAVLQTFSEGIADTIKVPWYIDEAVQGGLALRLLAAQSPGRISDNLVKQLTWLDGHIASSAFHPEATQELRKLIGVAWERSLLERGGPTGPTEESRGRSAPGGRRII